MIIVIIIVIINNNWFWWWFIVKIITRIIKLFHLFNCLLNYSFFDGSNPAHSKIWRSNWFKFSNRHSIWIEIYRIVSDSSHTKTVSSIGFIITRANQLITKAKSNELTCQLHFYSNRNYCWTLTEFDWYLIHFNWMKQAENDVVKIPDE